MAAPGLVLQGKQVLAELTFTAPNESASVPVRLTQIVGDRESGLPLNRASTRDGQIIIVQERPVLEVVPGWTPPIHLYGHAGRTHVIETAANLGAGAVWTQVLRIVATRSEEPLDLPARGAAPVFYRARVVQ